MAKKLNLTTIKEMKTQPIIYAVMYLFGALILLMLGLTIATKESKEGGTSTLNIGVGLLMALGGGGFCGYKAYSIVVDPKNAKTCNADYWNKYECVANPAGKDADYELNIDECKAQTNAQYKGYAGVWLTANTATTVDAFYISGDKTTVPLIADNSSKSGYVFTRKAKAIDDNDKGVTVTGVTSTRSACTTTTTTGTSPSSPRSP